MLALCKKLRDTYNIAAVTNVGIFVLGRFQNLRSFCFYY